MQAELDFPDAQQPRHAPRWRARFESPVEVLETWNSAAVLPLLERVCERARLGYWCVGALAYEAATALDASLPTTLNMAAPAAPAWPTPDPGAQAAQPLLRFGIFERALPLPAPPTGPPALPTLRRWLGASRTPHPEALDQMQRALAAMQAGECYQINLTSALEGQLLGQVADWWAALRAFQPDGYLAWIDAGAQHILSASPELFFDLRPAPGAAQLLCRPMKGTAARHADPATDERARAALRACPKEQAENIMIVDLLRNDLGRLAHVGSVRAAPLLEVEAWPGVWQMTSTVQALLPAGTDALAVLRALFPCGSVTGAPKRRAMHWIAQLERQPRGVYCGTVGVIRPGGHCTFNVPIRTLQLQAEPAPPPSPQRSAAPGTAPPRWRLHYGAGSGLTVYAEPAAEWDEWLAKARLLERLQTPFELLETLRLEDGRYPLRARHWARLQASAAALGFACSATAFEQALAEAAQGHPSGVWRVRLTLHPHGQMQTQTFALAPTPEPVRVALAAQPLATDGALAPWIAHKTTLRAHYDARAPLSAAVFDHLLWNERGELTEFTRGNLALQLDGLWLTPALSSGLLGGTARAEYLAQGRLRTAVLTRADYAAAEGIAFINGLRGWLRAERIDLSGPSAVAAAPGVDAPTCPPSR